MTRVPFKGWQKVKAALSRVGVDPGSALAEERIEFHKQCAEEAPDVYSTMGSEMIAGLIFGQLTTMAATGVIKVADFMLEVPRLEN